MINKNDLQHVKALQRQIDETIAKLDELQATAQVKVSALQTRITALQAQMDQAKVKIAATPANWGELRDAANKMGACLLPNTHRMADGTQRPLTNDEVVQFYSAWQHTRGYVPVVQTYVQLLPSEDDEAAEYYSDELNNFIEERK